MPWMECDKMDQKLKFIARLVEGEKMAPLCREFGITRPTGYKIFNRDKKMGELAGETKWYEISRLLEQEGKKAFKARKGSDIFVNVDFYSASLYYSMGIPIDFFTPVFAISRVAGWAAHVLEERFAEAAPKPALYRPKSEYIGDYCGPDECAFVPRNKR